MLISLSHTSCESEIAGSFDQRKFFSTLRNSCSPLRRKNIASGTQGIYSLTCFSVGKRTSDWSLSLALCWNVLDFSQFLHRLVCRVCEIVMNDSLEDREQVESCHFRGIEIHSSSEVEGPHEKAAEPEYV